MTPLFYCLFALLIAADLIKGLSANGTPPIMQAFRWQLDLAHFMWNSITLIRLVLGILLVALLIAIITTKGISGSLVTVSLLLLCLWVFIYWLFNHFWVGKRKFLPLENPQFASVANNTVNPTVQVIGVDFNGAQKAYPVSMCFYHHQIPDRIANHPIWVTYCGLCRSGRVYDLLVDGEALTFSLVGAISFNATFQDLKTGSWWRQETGDAVKGPYTGKALKDLAFEQMSLANWIAKYPTTEILQYDPTFQPKYNFITKLLNYEASLPGWHRQETPPLIIGVDINGQARAYDWKELNKLTLLQDDLGSTPLLLQCAEDHSSAFVFDRRIDGITLEFERDGNLLRDTATGSEWDHFGKCISGQMQGAQLTTIQCYQQFIRGWLTFHPHTDFFDFNSPGQRTSMLKD